MNEDTQYARASDKIELRGEIPGDLMRAADALALVADMTRIRWVEMLIEREVMKEHHRHSLLGKMWRGNPLLSASTGVDGNGGAS